MQDLKQSNKAIQTTHTSTPSHMVRLMLEGSYLKNQTQEDNKVMDVF